MVAITQQSLSDEIRRQQKLARAIASDQAAISSGNKISAPSQDPQTWVQISEIGRAQAEQGAWAANVAYGKTRASKAESNLDEIGNLISRARELTISAANGSLDAPGKSAVATELQTIKGSINELLNEKDYQGVPVFDNNTQIAVPVSRGLNIPVVGTRQDISDGIDVGNGANMTLDQIFDAAIAAVQADDASAQTTTVGYFDSATSHIVLEQSVQGVRGDRLDAATDRLTDIDQSLTERRSGLEDTDLTETLTRMQARLLSLEAAQSALARINRQTLFDLIGT
jgi:flagellar hook-associated protein 3 FlgL